MIIGCPLIFWVQDYFYIVKRTGDGWQTNRPYKNFLIWNLNYVIPNERAGELSTFVTKLGLLNQTMKSSERDND
jgi:hypothetical protein